MAEEQAKKQKGKADHLKPWQYKKGQSGNPNGRPKGAISMKEYIRKKLSKMTPEEREEYLDGIDKKIIWEMAEGKAPQTIDSSVEVTLPKPLLDNVHNYDSDQETDDAEGED